MSSIKATREESENYLKGWRYTVRVGEQLGRAVAVATTRREAEQRAEKEGGTACVLRPSRDGKEIQAWPLVKGQPVCSVWGSATGYKRALRAADRAAKPKAERAPKPKVERKTKAKKRRRKIIRDIATGAIEVVPPRPETRAIQTVLDTHTTDRVEWKLVHQTAGLQVAGSGMTEVRESWGVIGRLVAEGTQTGQWYKTEDLARAAWAKLTGAAKSAALPGPEDYLAAIGYMKETKSATIKQAVRQNSREDFIAWATAWINSKQGYDFPGRHHGAMFDDVPKSLGLLWDKHRATDPQQVPIKRAAEPSPPSTSTAASDTSKDATLMAAFQSAIASALG